MTTSDFGRATEARFVMDASTRGMIVSKPHGDAPGYDALVDLGPWVLKVQVKGVTRGKRGDYRINVNRHSSKAAMKYDILAVWLEQDAKWVFCEVDAVSAYRSIGYRPSGIHGKNFKGWEIFG